MNRRGFTLIELLTVVAIIGLLASIALPKYQYLRKKAVAAEIVSAMRTARGGAFQYAETAGTWPPSAGRGRVPRGLGPYLPGGGTALFRTPSYQLTWNTRAVGGGGRRTTQSIAAFMNDGPTCQAVYGLWGGSANPDVTSQCGRRSGSVFLWVDR
jgi:prepilin-type N-terminal cleavage/methylation domain-containing protein